MTSGLIFFACATTWISRCSLATILAIFFLIRSESRAPCQREVRMRLPVKVHQWQTQPQRFQRRPDQSTCFLHSPWSARENPSQDLGFPVKPGNDAKGQGDLTRTRKLVQTTQNPEVERQENAQSSDSCKQ